MALWLDVPVGERSSASYFRRIVPVIGALVAGNRAAYTYLPRSVERFVTADELARLMEKAPDHQWRVYLLCGWLAGLRLGEARERLRAEIGKIEQSADLPSRRIGDDQRVRRGQVLKPGGEIGCLANHSLFLRRALANQITDDH